MATPRRAGRGVGDRCSPGRFTLGVGPSHQPVVEGMLGLPYSTAGRHTDEYVQIAAALQGERVRFAGQEFRVNAGPLELLDGAAIPVLVAALDRGCSVSRAARVGARFSGWRTPSRSSSTLRRVSAKPPPMLAGPICVSWPGSRWRCTTTSPRRAVRRRAVRGVRSHAELSAHLGGRGVAGPAEAAIVGDEAGVTASLEALVAAGVTDVWAAPFPVGDDRWASRARTRHLLERLVAG